MNNTKTRLIVGTALSLAAAFPGAAYAQEQDNSDSVSEGSGIADIVVTARRREESVQDTPIAITAISGETLAAQNVTDATKLSQLAPSLNVFKSGGFTTLIGVNMRGIGFADSVLGQDSPMGIYVDGVYNGRVGAGIFELVELERIEVLRGPQGTLFGRNTIAGAISIVTRNPSDEMGYELKGRVGNHGLYEGRMRFDSGELGNSGVKFTMAYQHRQHGGYQDVPNLKSSRDPEAENSDALWGKLQGEWGKYKLTVVGDWNHLRAEPPYLQILSATDAVKAFFAKSPAAGGDIFVAQKRYLSEPPFNGTKPARQRALNRGVGITNELEVNDKLSLKAITSWRGFDAQQSAFFNSNRLGGVFLFPPTFRTPTPSVQPLYDRDTSYKFRQFSQEVQALAEIGDVNLVLGGYYFNESADVDSVSDISIVGGGGAFATFFTSWQDYTVFSKSYAGFAQASWRPDFLNDKLEITGGVRYTEDKKRVERQNYNSLSVPTTQDSAAEKWTNTDFLASLSYDVSDDLMLFARFSTGYRSGGFNTRGATIALFQPEDLTSYEGGFKADLLDRRLRINGSVYYNEYKNLQVSQFEGLTGGRTLNASANYTGFEIEVQAQPVDAVTLTGAVGYVDPQYDQFFQPNPAGGAPLDLTDVSKFGNVAKWTANGSISVVAMESDSGKLTLRGNVSYMGSRHYYTNLVAQPLGPTMDDPGFTLFGARATFSEIPLGALKASVSVYGENLTNEHAVANAFDLGPSLGYAAASYQTPRTFGLEVSVKY